MGNAFPKSISWASTFHFKGLLDLEPPYHFEMIFTSPLSFPASPMCHLVPRKDLHHLLHVIASLPRRSNPPTVGWSIKLPASEHPRAKPPIPTRPWRLLKLVTFPQCIQQQQNLLVEVVATQDLHCKRIPPHEVPVSIKYILYIHLWHNTLCFFFHIHIIYIYLLSYIFIYIHTYIYIYIIIIYCILTTFDIDIHIFNCHTPRCLSTKNTTLPWLPGSISNELIDDLAVRLPRESFFQLAIDRLAMERTGKSSRNGLCMACVPWLCWILLNYRRLCLSRL